MTFSPATWVGVAEKCLGPIPNTDPEASLRTAAGRAYYAALMTIAEKVAEAGGRKAIDALGDATHRRIREAVASAALRRPPAPKFIALRDGLRDLGELRNAADYHLFDAFDRNRAEEAEKIGRRLVGLLTGMSKGQFQDLLP